MFSNILAVALGALAIARAAPLLQTPLVSCNVDLGTTPSIGTAANAFQRITDGTYIIYNVASGTFVRGSAEGGAAFVRSTPDVPGPYEFWNVFHDGDKVQIYNAGLGLATVIGPKDEIVLVGPPNRAEHFTLTAIGDNEPIFTIGAKGKAWTVNPEASTSIVTMQTPRGGREELWEFRKVKDLFGVHGVHSSKLI